MNAELNQLVNEARAAFSAALQPAALENEKARYPGKNGAITARLKTLAKLTPDEKRAAGAEINAAKEAIEALLAERRQALAEVRLNEQLATESIDVVTGAPHRGCYPSECAVEGGGRIEEIFRSMARTSPRADEPMTNFTALNRRRILPRSRCRIFLRRCAHARRTPVVLAHSHQSDAGALRAHASSADQVIASGLYRL